MNMPRLYASIGTALVVGVSFALMMCSSLRYDEVKAAPLSDRGEIVMAEEFFDVVEMPPSPNMYGDEPSAAQAQQSNDAQPAPAPGTDMVNSGTAGSPPKPVASDAEQPVKQDTRQPEKTGPSADELRREEESRQADNDVMSAFSSSQGQHNTASGANDTGNSGNPSSSTQQGSFMGAGEGTATGGWSLPKYNKVKSRVTGMVKLKVTIDRNGHPISVEVVASKAPAGTTPSVLNACKIEVQSRNFTRPNPDDAPESAVAYVTYTFQ